MAMACAASEAASISPISSAAALKIVTSKASMPAIGRPSRSRPGSAASRRARSGRTDDSGGTSCSSITTTASPANISDARQRGGEARAGNAHRGKAEIAEDQAPVGEGVEGDGDDDDDQRPARPLQRGDERAQHDVAVEGQHRPLQPVHIDAGLAGQRRLLAHGQRGSPRRSTAASQIGMQTSTAIHRPWRTVRRRSRTEWRLAAELGRHHRRGRQSSGRGRRSAARNRDWRRARRRPACPGPAAPSS